MAQTFIAGPDSAYPTGITGGCAWNAFTVSITQSIARGVTFGVHDSHTRGCVLDKTVVLSGVLSQGTSADKYSPAGFGSVASASSAVTLTFATGCTVIMNLNQSGVSASTAMESMGGSSYSFVGDGVVTGAWATS